MESRHILAVIVMGLLTLVTEAAVFHYQASVWTGTSVAMTTKAQWSIRARVIMVHDLVQVTNAEVSVYNGGSIQEHYFVPVPTAASQFEQPFALRYNEGKLAGLSVVPGEDVWAVNMKRGLATLLQLDSEALSSPLLAVEENLLYGLCVAEYTSFVQENVTVIRKFVDHETCRESPQKTLGQCIPILCSQNPQVPVESYTDTTYRAHTHEGRLELQSVVATSQTFFHLLMSHASHVIVVNQSLEKEREEERNLLIHIPENMTLVGITFELPSNDLSQGRDPASQQYIYNKVTHTFSELSRDLDQVQVGADPDEHHKNLITSAIDWLQLAEPATLQKLFNYFNLGTSYQQETARYLFFDILPKVGSHASTLVMRDLIIEKKVNNATAIHFLTFLPFHIREPTEDLLTDMQVLLTASKDFVSELKNAVVLSFANLVRKTCKNACRPETLDSYIRYFLNCFTGSKKYRDQLLYLDALSNIEIGSVFDYLASIVRGNVTLQSPHLHYIRYRAMWAAATTASLHPVQVQELCWPVLMNQSEPLDIRVAALTTLTISDPTSGVFLSLFSYMQSEVDSHLYYHYYTTLQSLADTTFPCYKELGFLARKVLPVARKPAIEFWSSGNYILDFSDTKFQFGAITHVILVPNKRTGWPNVFHFFFGTREADYITTRTELFVRLDGVEVIVRQKLLQLLRSTSSIPHLMDMLDKLDIKPTPTEPLHIELALNLHGSTILSQYTDLSTWKAFVKELRTVMSTQLGAHVKHHQSAVQLMNGNYFTTSAGTLAFTRAQAVGLTSLRGDVAWEQANLQTDMDISMFHSTAYELTTFNPILNMWQTAETSHAVRSHLVINNRLDILEPLGFNLSVYHPTGSSAGLVWHKRTRVFMKGREVDRTLRSLCPTCEMAVDVITGNKDKKSRQLLNMPIPDVGSRLQVHVLKCDACPDGGSIFSLLHSTLNRYGKNYRIMPSSRPFLMLLHFAAHVLVAPPDDISGYSVQIVSTHNQLTKLELSAQLDMRSYLETSGNGPIHLHILFAHKMLQSDNSLWAWKVTSQLTMPLQSDSYSVDAELIKTTVGEPTYSVCLQLETELQKSDGLSVRNLLSNILKSRGTMSWGKVDNTTLLCPDSDGHLQILLAAQASDEQKEMATVADKWPYNTCLAAADNTAGAEGDWLLLHPACSQVISELSTPRTVTAVIKNIDEKNEQTIHSLLGFTADSKTKELTITAEFPILKNEMELSVNGYHMTSAMGASLVYPWLSNALLPATDSILNNWIHTCIINASNVRTFDEAFVEAEVPACYIIGAAEWSQNPTFSIMVRTLSGSSQLGLKIYSGSNYLEIISRYGCTTITVNGEMVKAEETIKIVNSFGLSINKRGDTEIIAPPVIVVYKITYITITVAPLLQGSLLGLCGDQNGDPSNDWNVRHIMTCPLQ